MQVHAGASSR